MPISSVASGSVRSIVSSSASLVRRVVAALRQRVGLGEALDARERAGCGAGDGLVGVDEVVARRGTERPGGVEHADEAATGEQRHGNGRAVLDESRLEMAGRCRRRRWRDTPGWCPRWPRANPRAMRRGVWRSGFRLRTRAARRARLRRRDAARTAADRRASAARIRPAPRRRRPIRWWPTRPRARARRCGDAGGASLRTRRRASRVGRGRSSFVGRGVVDTVTAMTAIASAPTRLISRTTALPTHDRSASNVGGRGFDLT